MKTLTLATDLKLPIEVVTQTIAILAKRRAGKSYTMRRLVEQLVHAGQQVVLVDPKGDQWGIRSAADGKAPGLPLVILGGERADVPLEVGAGEMVAKLVVEERVSAVLDLSLFRKKEVATFMTEFLENLYRLKAREIYRTPMMLVVDEADAIAPQKPMPGEERMLGAIEDIVRRGGQRGVGCVVITQRSAVLNKNVLTQAQILVALRTIAPQDLKAMKEWIDVHGDEAERKILMESLPSLPTGDAWFWSPGWPTGDGIFQRVHVLPIETFDSGATPKPGEKRTEPKTVADVDLDALKRQMAATIAKAKADDPRELRRRIAELQRELETAKRFKVSDRIDAKTQSPAKPVLTDADRGLLAKLNDQISGLRSDVWPYGSRAIRALGAFQQALDEFKKGVDEHDAWFIADLQKRLDAKGLQKVLAKLEGLSIQLPVISVANTNAQRVKLTTPASRYPAPNLRTSEPRNLEPRTKNQESALPPGEHATLTAALQYEGLDRKRLGILTGYKRSSRDAYIVRLAAKGLVEVRGAQLFPTDAGRAALNGSFEPLPTGAALVEYWLARLPEGERRVFDMLVKDGGDVNREAIDQQTGYKRSSRDAYLVRLKARGLVEFAGRGMVRASGELFD